MSPKQPSPPKPAAPTPKKTAIPSDSLLKLLRSHEYSDITIVVGTGPTLRIYNLHRNIVCTKSKYFELAIQYHIQSGSRHPQIQLPDILPPIFDILLEWIYGDMLVLEVHQPLILSLYRAANFLQLQGMQITIAKQVSKMLKRKRKLGRAVDFDGFEIVRGMFEYTPSSTTSFTSLRKCTDELALGENIPKSIIEEELARLGTGKEGDTRFWMALAVSYQKALECTICKECRNIVSTRMILDRMCCHCDSEGEGGKKT
ncbi:hypothetical protein TWF694_005767 [Orbilia ellipsospora]|uniref:BTB domain-containing protein n=1 Tax=Orbilia ellipsospora TaxID=2528407 RepID=A0AAV9WT07_9PEZI